MGYGPSAFLPTNGGIQNAGGQRGQFPTTSHNRRLTARRTRPVTINDLRPNIPKTIHRGSTFLLLIRWPFHSSLVVEPGHLLLWLDLPTRTRSHLQVSHTPPNVFVTAKYLCSLTTQTQKSATTTPTGGNDLPRDRVAMREICQLLRTQSAQVSALQRQQDAGRSSFRGFLAEAESSAQHSLSLKLSEADQQYYQNYELKKQTM